MPEIKCPCRSLQNYSDCCGLYHKQSITAPTPEALMRSRYSAFHLAEIDYLIQTVYPTKSSNKLKEELASYCQQITFINLEIISAPKPTEKTARVEFKAWYKEAGSFYCQHELSNFIQIDKAWYYEDGDVIGDGKPIKISRNDVCLCGSHKKYKKCCDQSAQ